jgi:hypothetical protein
VIVGVIGCVVIYYRHIVFEVTLNSFHFTLLDMEQLVADPYERESLDNCNANMTVTIGLKIHSFIKLQNYLSRVSISISVMYIQKPQTQRLGPLPRCLSSVFPTSQNTGRRQYG